MIEIWKDIKGFEELYQVSNFGRLKRLQRKIVTKDNVSKTLPKKILLQYINRKGYSVITLNKNKKGIISTHSIHQLVAKAFISNPNNKYTVNHINGIKTDNRVENLEWATQRENVKHAYDTGLKKCMKGSKNHSAKLTETDVKQIRRLLTHNTQRELARVFKVSDGAISFIANNKTWKHI
jgi:hypothetical protein